jgi:hypothetical protein
MKFKNDLMKRILNIASFLAALLLLLASCEKEGIKAVLQPGKANTLTASAVTLVLDSTGAATTLATAFKWDPVKYGIAVATNYTLQIDTLKDDFANGVNVPLANSLSKSYTVAELNQVALLLGLPPDSASTLQARVTADVQGLNSAPQAVATVYSNTLTLTVTPYATIPPTKYPVPDSLYIVGDATAGGWGNPVPVPAQRFTKIDYATFGIILPLTGGKQYLLIPTNGDWGHKYAVADNTVPAVKTGTDFIPDAGENIDAPAASGLYQIIVDFVKGTYAVTPVDPATIPDKLYIVGDATPGGWNNPVPADQELTKTSAYTFSITLNLTGGKAYLLLPVNGSWTHKYAVPDDTDPSLKMGGTFKEDASKNIPGPAEGGTYRIDVNFLTDTYSLTKL